MMLSFGVFCFDLVVNKNCSLVIMEKTWISWTRPKSFFECFISTRELLDPSLPSTGDTYFLSGLSPQKKIFHVLIFLKVRKCAVLAVYV